MRLICPSCGAAHSAEAWTADGDARQCLRIVAELPTEVSRRTLAYLAMFRPTSGRGLVWSKALRLLGELQVLVADATVQWDGRVARPNSAAAWAGALERVIQMPPKRLPLTSHGYLRAIAWEIADEMDRAREVSHNQAERDGSLRRELSDGRTSTETLEAPLTREQMRALREQRRRTA